MRFLGGKLQEHEGTYLIKKIHFPNKGPGSLKSSIKGSEGPCLGITEPKPNSRIMEIFKKNLFEVVKCTKTKNMKNKIFHFGAPLWPKNDIENSKYGFLVMIFFLNFST